MALEPVTLIMQDRGDGTMASYDVGRLSAPVGLRAGTPEARSITLTWDYVDDGQTGFEIEQSADGVTWSLIAAPGSGARIRHISNLSPETTYHFRIRAVDSGDSVRNSAWATPITVVTSEAPSVPGEFVQLQNYAGADLPLDIYYPRPDVETQVWARHRKSHPSVPYRVPVIGAFGAPPWFFELLEGPPGMAIGAFLPKLPNGKYDWENPGDYGVVTWDSPTADGMPENGWLVKVRATDQELTVKEVEWRLVVTTDGFLFVDPINGDDANPGTIDQPLKTTRGWYLEDEYDDTYSGYHVIYRGGMHEPYFRSSAANEGAGFFYGRAKPLVHYGFPGELVNWKFNVSAWNLGEGSQGGASARMGCSDIFIGEISMDQFGQRAGGNTIAFHQGGSFCTDESGYGPDGSGCRMTFFNIDVDGLNESIDVSDNAGFTFGFNPNGTKNPAPYFRRYHCFSRVRLTNSYQTTGLAGVNWKFNSPGACEKTAMEFVTCENTDMNFPYSNKSGSSFASITYAKVINGTFIRQLMGEDWKGYRMGHLVGNEAWRYLKHDPDPENYDVSTTIFPINHGSAEPHSLGGWLSIHRATLVNRLPKSSVISIAKDWEAYVRRCIFVSDRPAPMIRHISQSSPMSVPRNYPDDADWARLFQIGVDTVPLDENLDLTAEGEGLRGQFGAEIWEEAV